MSHDIPESGGHGEQTTAHPPQVHDHLRVSAACQMMISATWCSLYETSSSDSVQTLANAPLADSWQSCQKMKISKSIASEIHKITPVSGFVVVISTAFFSHDEHISLTSGVYTCV